MTAPAISTLPEFVAHALAIEDEAAVRYRELAEQMTVHHNDAAARLFTELAAVEAKHAAALRASYAGTPVQRLAPWDYRWITPEAPETASFASAHYRMTAYHALSLALAAEERAVAFFTAAAAAATTPALRTMAGALADEEREHVAMVQELLAREPAPPPDWDFDPDPPSEPE